MFRIRIHLIRIRVLGWIRVQGFDEKKCKKNLLLKKIFVSKTTINLPLGLRKGFPSYRRSLQSTKENIQHFKTWNLLIFFYFCGSFLLSWSRIRIPNPDTDLQTWLNPDSIRIRIQNSNKMLFPIGSETEGSGVSLSEFKDKLDLEAGATVAGHSFGGATTVLSLAKVIFWYFLLCTLRY